MYLSHAPPPCRNEPLPSIWNGLLVDPLTGSRTICRGQFVAKNINFIEFPAPISATFFSSIPLPFKEAFVSSIPLPIQQHIFITLASYKATLVSSIPLPFQETVFSSLPLPF